MLKDSSEQIVPWSADPQVTPTVRQDETSGKDWGIMDHSCPHRSHRKCAKIQNKLMWLTTCFFKNLFFFLLPLKFPLNYPPPPDSWHKGCLIGEKEAKASVSIIVHHLTCSATEQVSLIRLNYFINFFVEVPSPICSFMKSWVITILLMNG